MGNICKKIRTILDSKTHTKSDTPTTPIIELGYDTNDITPTFEVDTNYTFEIDTTPKFEIDITKNKLYQRRLKRRHQLENV